MSSGTNPTPDSPRSNTGDIIREARGFGAWIAGLKSSEVMTFMVVMLMMFVCGMYGYQNYTTSKQQVEMRNAEMRSNAEREELMRQHCANECEKARASQKSSEERLQAFFGSQLEIQRKHDTDQDDKNRSLLSLLMERMVRLEQATRTKP